MAKQVTIVASDFGDSNIAFGLFNKLQDPTHKVFLGGGKIPPPFSEVALHTAVAESDLVILSTSEHCVMEVCAAEHAIGLGKPLGLIALFYGQLRKKEYTPFRPYVRLVFVLDEAEAAEAKTLYPNATVIVSGNPEWETFSSPKRTSEEVREILKIAPGEKLILVSGEKEIGVNVPLAVNVIEAVASLPNPKAFKIIFTVHPGHVPLPGGVDLLEFYKKELGGYNPQVSVSVSCKATPFGIGTPDMVPGADMVIGTNSTVQIQAAHLRIPAVAILLRRAFRGLDMPKTHSGWWTPCDAGAIEPIYGLSSYEVMLLIATMDNTKSGFVSMRTAQERLFPPRRTGEAYETMIRAIENF